MRKLVYSVKHFKNKEGVTRYVANYLNESKAGELYHSEALLRNSMELNQEVTI